MNPRTNDEWLRALNEEAGEARDDALQELHEYLLRAVLLYLSWHRTEFSDQSLLSVRDLAEDLAQESLLEILEHLNSFKGQSKFTTWAYRFVIHRAASELRRFHYRDISLDDLQNSAPQTFQSILFEQIQDERTRPEQLAERHYFRDLLWDILQNELTEHQRLAIVGVHWQGLSMDEVANMLGLTRNALYKLLYDARKRIKESLLARHLSKSDILAAFENWK